MTANAGHKPASEQRCWVVLNLQPPPSTPQPYRALYSSADATTDANFVGISSAAS